LPVRIRLRGRRLPIRHDRPPIHRAPIRLNRSRDPDRSP